jgi:hypothetical protein
LALAEHAPTTSHLPTVTHTGPQHPITSFGNRVFAFGEDCTLREDTVCKLCQLVFHNRAVHVRGTPTSGKTVLSQLLYMHVQKAYPNLSALHLTWRIQNSRPPQSHKWDQLISYESEGCINKKEIPVRSDLFLIIDEAQLSALRGPRIRAPPNVIATLIRRHFKRPAGAASGRNTKLDEQRDIEHDFWLELIKEALPNKKGPYI